MSQVKENTVSVVVPVYNSQNSLPLLLNRIGLVLADMCKSFEVILVNDYSLDKSWDQIKDLAKKYPWAYGIDLMRNYGQHNALLCGIRHAKNEIIITIDDDLQNPPEQIPVLLNELEKGYDVVYGFPKHQQHGLMRDFASWITKKMLQKTMGIAVAENISAFRVFRSDLRRAFTSYHGPSVCIDVLLTWGGRKFAAIPVEHQKRTIGESNYTLTKLILHTLNMITGFTVFPLQFVSVLGFIMFFFGASILFYVLGRFFLVGSSVAGFPFLASIIAIFSGTQFLALGIIGEYLARMHFRTMGQPIYKIRSEAYHGL